MRVIRPTIEWMQQKFKEYNKKYFEGKLQTPKFSLNCHPNIWGAYIPQGTFNALTRRVKLMGYGTICLNGNFARLEKDWMGTLLHEMIHMYINTVLMEYPALKHGKLFQNWANKLNQDGWNISEYNEMKETDIRNGEEINVNNTQNLPQYVFCILEHDNPKLKYWGFRADKKSMNQFIESARNLKWYGAKILYEYSCFSENLRKLPMSSQDLTGIKANSFNELITKISSVIGEQLTKENFVLVNKIKL